MNIFIRTFNGKLLNIKVSKYDIIYKIKNHIKNELNIPNDAQSLIYNGKHLKDNNNIFNYKIKKNDFIELFIKSKGGVPVVATVVEPAASVWYASEGAAKAAISLKSDANAQAIAAAEEAMTDKNFFIRLGGWTSKFVRTNYQWVLDFTFRRASWIVAMVRFAFMFAQFIRLMALFFVIIILFKLIIGFFTQPLEFIMLFIAMILLSIMYVVYSILKLPPFIWLLFGLWFFFFDVIPFLIYTFALTMLFLFIFVICLILSAINLITGGMLKPLVLCQNSVASWFKSSNWHLHNKHNRALMCSRECFPGYYPDKTGSFCMKLPRGTPSFCPQAEAMRLYMGTSRHDYNYYYKDYNIANIKYILKSPSEREHLLKDYYLKKKNFLHNCDFTMNKFNFMSLGICSSLDIFEKNNINGIDKKTINKLRNVCNQAYCNSNSNYPFCQRMFLGESNVSTSADFWILVCKILIFITVLIFIIFFTLGYMSGVTMFPTRG